MVPRIISSTPRQQYGVDPGEDNRPAPRHLRQ
jgi:hypothetical protein